MAPQKKLPRCSNPSFFQQATPVKSAAPVLDVVQALLRLEEIWKTARLRGRLSRVRLGAPCD